MDQCVTPVNVTGITHLAETGACKNTGSLFAGRVRLTCYASGQTLSIRCLFLADLTRSSFKISYSQVVCKPLQSKARQTLSIRCLFLADSTRSSFKISYSQVVCGSLASQAGRRSASGACSSLIRRDQVSKFHIRRCGGIGRRASFRC